MRKKQLPLFVEMVMIENVVDEFECCLREGEEVDEDQHQTHDNAAQHDAGYADGVAQRAGGEGAQHDDASDGHVRISAGEQEAESPGDEARVDQMRDDDLQVGPFEKQPIGNDVEYHENGDDDYDENHGKQPSVLPRVPGLRIRSHSNRPRFKSVAFFGKSLPERQAFSPAKGLISARWPPAYNPD